MALDEAAFVVGGGNMQQEREKMKSLSGKSSIHRIDTEEFLRRNVDIW